MKMRSLVALAVVAALGCSREAPPGPEVKDPAASTVPPRDTPPGPSQPSPSQPVQASTPAPAPQPPPPGFAYTELAPTQGELLPLLAKQVERAREKKLRAVAYFYADWCPPCKVFQANIEDPRMKEALKDVFLVKLNLDDWHEKTKPAGYHVKFIPSFFLIEPDGKPTPGKLLDGDKWGKKATVETMVASINKFLAP